MKEFLSFGGLGIPGVCSKGMLGFSEKMVMKLHFIVEKYGRGIVLDYLPCDSSRDLFWDGEFT